MVLHSSKTRCVHIVVLYIIQYICPELKLKIRLRSDSVKKCLFSTTAFIIYIYL